MSRKPNYEFQEWWNKQRENNNSSSSSSNHHHDLFLPDHSNDSSFLTVEIRSPAADRTVEKDRSRSARQISWLCLLRFQQIKNSFAYVTNATLSLLRTARRRVSAASSASRRSESKMYRAIKAFLVILLVLLAFELVAYFKGWHFSPPTVRSDFVVVVYANWIDVRARYLAPALQSLTSVCVFLFLVQSVDRVVLVLGCAWIKLRRLKPVAVMEYPGEEEERGHVKSEEYPMVLVQIPMCNEREVRRCRFRIPTCATLFATVF